MFEFSMTQLTEGERRGKQGEGGMTLQESERKLFLAFHIYSAHRGIKVEALIQIFFICIRTRIWVDFNHSHTLYILVKLNNNHLNKKVFSHQFLSLPILSFLFLLRYADDDCARFLFAVTYLTFSSPPGCHGHRCSTIYFTQKREKEKKEKSEQASKKTCQGMKHAWGKKCARPTYIHACEMAKNKLKRVTKQT